MKTYYCHNDFSSGITCLARTNDGKCVHNGISRVCEYRSITPKYIGATPPMPKVKPPKRKSTDCAWCKHKDVCKLKDKFNELKENNYPLVCECENYLGYNPLEEV